MRLSTFLIPLPVFLLAAAASVMAARATVAVVEDVSVGSVQEALMAGGLTWARVLGDGLQVVIEGEAPTEAVRFRAMSAAGSMVDASRVIDNMSVTPSAAMMAPAFAIEILRNDSGVSLIGLIPADTDRIDLSRQIADIAGTAAVTDLLETADYDIPAGWRRSLAFALRALDRLPRSKISVQPGFVSITAISDSTLEKQRLETALSRDAPEGMRLALAISAPRPVITPFTVRFAIDEGGARFDACAADTEAAQQAILSAAAAAGAAGRQSCTIGLGVPTGDWGDAVAMGIAALSDLGGGTITYSDADVALVALQGTEQAAFDRVVGDLANALPDVFALDAVLPEVPEPQPEGPPTFSGTLSPEGAVQIRGRVSDALMNETVENFANARFGREAVTMGTRIVDGLPQGWTVRTLAGIEVLSQLANGSVMVTPDDIAVRGNTGNRDANGDISRLLIERLGQAAAFQIDVTYVEALDPISDRPTPEECVRKITVVTADRKILFDPGSASMTRETQPIVDDIAEILRRCADLRIEIAGYTDSQGRDQMNLDLSQDRADAVLDALRARRVPVGTFVSVGYGEVDPIADNGSAEGRESNRRIEFRLIVPEPVADAPTTPETIEDDEAADVPPEPDDRAVVEATGDEGSGD